MNLYLKSPGRHGVGIMIEKQMSLGFASAVRDDVCILCASQMLCLRLWQTGRTLTTAAALYEHVLTDFLFS